MLQTLKAKMRNDVMFNGALESALYRLTESTDDDIKDIFLDDPEAIVIGAEDDPKIEKIVDSIPEDVDEDTKEVTAKDIEDLVENYVPNSKLGYFVFNESDSCDCGDDDCDDCNDCDDEKFNFIDDDYDEEDDDYEDDLDLDDIID